MNTVVDMPAQASAEPLSRRERRKQEVRSRIIEAAVDVFEKKGCEEATVEEICEMADVARKTFYNYFSDKTQLIDEMTNTLLIEETGHRIDLALEKFDNTRDRLHFMLSTTKQNILSSEKLERELVVWSMMRLASNVKGGGQQLEHFNQSLERMFQAGVELGDVPEKYTARFLAEMAGGMMNTIILNWVHNPDYDAFRRVDDMESLLMDLLDQK